MSDTPQLYDNLCGKLKHYVSSTLGAPSKEESDSLYEMRTRVCTEIIASSLTDALYWAYKEQGEIQLRDCLLPDNLGRIERAWHKDMILTGLSQEQVEDLLRKFGEGEISDKLELPVGLYVKRVGEGYELRKSEEVK